MAIENGYTTLVDLKRAIDPKEVATWSPAEDVLMEIAIEAASRWIDAELGTRFYVLPETRYYMTEFHDVVYTHDFTVVTGVKTDSNGDGVYDRTWTTAEYLPYPMNAPLQGLPYTQIRTRSAQGYYPFPSWPHSVQVAASFGFSEKPPGGIVQACLLIAHRLYKRREAIFGVGTLPQGNSGMVMVQTKIQRDADITLLLQSVPSRSWV